MLLKEKQTESDRSALVDQMSRGSCMKEVTLEQGPARVQGAGSFSEGKSPVCTEAQG